MNTFRSEQKHINELLLVLICAQCKQYIDDAASLE